MAVSFEPRWLVPAAVGLLFALLRKYVRPAPLAPKEGPFTSAEVQSFNRIKWWVGLAMLVVAVVFVIASHTALVYASKRFAEADGPAVFQFLPSGVIWWFFPMFGAAGLTSQITFFLWGLIGDRQQIRRYVEWGNAKIAFDGVKVLNWMVVLVVLPVGIVTLLATPMHSCLRTDDLVIRHFAALSSQHKPFSQARRITIVRGFRDRDGKFTARAGAVIDFADGFRWNSADDGDFRADVDPDLVEFLQRRTRLPTEDAETEKDIPRP